MSKAIDQDKASIRDQVKINHARELSDEIDVIDMSLEKALLLLQEVADGYFNSLDITTDEGQFGAICDFSRYGVYAEMVIDYVAKARNEVSKLIKEI